MRARTPDTIERVVNAVLDHLEHSEEHPIDAEGSINTDIFDGALPLTQMTPEDEDDFILMPSMEEIVTPSQFPIWPLDVRTAAFYDADDSWKEPRMQLVRLRTCQPKEFRGRAQFFSPWMLEETAAIILSGRTRTGMRRPLCLLGRKWVSGIGSRIDYTKATPKSDVVPMYETFDTPQMRQENFRIIRISFGFALTLRFEWSVLLGFGGPRVRLLTSPAGARAVFRLRDIPPGRQRRTALRHWVSQYWRQKRQGDNDPKLIAAYLRGETDFVWNGLRCKLEPSPFDIEQAKAKKLV
jgi:hypothetical protein